MANLFGSICLSDIPKELITTAKNGKKYLNIEVKQMRQPSQFGHTHTVKASVKKDERQEGVNYYIGNLKLSKFGNEGEAQGAQEASSMTQAPVYDVPNNPKDLPF
jgi:hypothetical protein